MKTVPAPYVPIALEPKFDSAMIGPSLHPERKTHYVYSAPQIARVLQLNDNMTEEAARFESLNIMIQAIKKHRTKAPIFVDDTSTAHISKLDI